MFLPVPDDSFSFHVTKIWIRKTILCQLVYKTMLSPNEIVLLKLLKQSLEFAYATQDHQVTLVSNIKP